MGEAVFDLVRSREPKVERSLIVAQVRDAVNLDTAIRRTLACKTSRTRGMPGIGQESGSRPGMV